jgi:ribosome biogenesis protein ERB1
MKQQLVKTLNPGVKWISSIDIHPLGGTSAFRLSRSLETVADFFASLDTQTDHVIVGSYDRRLVWHDLDLSTAPYKTLKYHERAIRAARYHPTLPLFVTASDDGNLHILHQTVYNDLLTNPLLVPLKRLHQSAPVDSLGVLDACWHPREAWVVTVAADGTAICWMI